MNPPHLKIASVAARVALNLFVGFNIVVAQTEERSPNWQALHFLIGDWIGEGTGTPGQGEGGFTYSLDLQDKIIIRKNFASYPETKDKPAYRHDDLMIVYQEPGPTIKADYFDNEGHVIHYGVQILKDSMSVIFTSAPGADEPRYRLTNTKLGDDGLTITFEIASPGKPETFQQYIKATARRKKG